MPDAAFIAETIRAEAGAAPVEFGLVLGSGLGHMADMVEGVAIPYADLPGFPRASVSGHNPKLVLGDLFGSRVALFGAREHYYEHGRPDAMRLPLEVLKALGGEKLILTNAAGSMRGDIPPGELMLLADHINFSGLNPLIGEPTDARFVPMKDAYDPELRAAFKAAAEAERIALEDGIYAWYSGPSFETPAEIRAIRTLGASSGMDTARHRLSTLISARAPHASTCPRMASTMVRASSSAFSWSALRHSARKEARSGTPLRIRPPSMTPTFAVVSSSMRPSCRAVTARAAARMALIPFSGSMPAWAALPRMSTSRAK
jgi:purine-nucleoside phosphorylase